MTEKKPTQGAQDRFQSLQGMLDATILFSGEAGGDAAPAKPLEGTIVDISAGCMCIRVPMNQSHAQTMREVEDGDFIEVRLSDSPRRHWTVLGHLAWVWAPPVEEGDLIGSLGVDIAGVIEDDQRWVGKVRNILTRERVVTVDKARRSIESPARRRAERGKASPASTNPEEDEETSADERDDEETEGSEKKVDDR